MQHKSIIPDCLQGGGEVLALRIAGEPVSDALRAQLVSRETPRPAKLELEVVSYLQPKTPNANYVRFKPSLLREFAESFVGKPVLRDHERGKLKARAGTITESKLVTRGSTPAIQQTLELVKDWAIEGALDGTFDRFSIGWKTSGEVLCTACNQNMFGGECSHMPGDQFQNADGEKAHVEMLFTKASGVETSAVSVPAVEGTGIDSIRAALSEARLSVAKPQKEKPMLKLLGLLGLAAEVDEQTACKQVEILLGEKDAHEATKKALVAAQEKLTAIEKSGFEKAVEELVARAIREGKMSPKSEAVANILRRTAELHGIEQAIGYLEAMPVVNPLADKSMRSSDAPPRDAECKHISDVQKLVNQQLGISDELHVKWNGQGA